MRLVCPNCEAKYEVPEDAIPETGRDVQCANCGHAWYQMRSRAPVVETATPPAAAPIPAPAAVPVPEPEVTVNAEAEPETVQEIQQPEEPLEPEPVAVEQVVEAVPEAEVSVSADEAVSDIAEVVPESAALHADAGSPEPDAEVEERVDPSAFAGDLGVTAVGVVPAIEAAVAEPMVAEEVAEADAAIAAEPAPAAYAVDESVLAILREEAEREAQARRLEAAKPLETQADLNVDAAMPAQAMETPVLASVEATRRTRLPDVEEINSTLRPAETVDEEIAAAESSPAEGRSSFRSGFLLVLTVAILGSALYG
ncbi:MAG: hypothetical protein EOP21_05095, partial [Hyphomicrobiales bacterium]